MADTPDRTSAEGGWAVIGHQECRICFLPLELHAERAIGIHIWCVKRQQEKPIMKGPAYGRRPIERS